MVSWANISTGLWDPLLLSDGSNFFGNSPTVIEWDNIVADINDKTLVLLGHPTPPPLLNRVKEYLIYSSRILKQSLKPHSNRIDGKPGHRITTQPALMENYIILIIIVF